MRNARRDGREFARELDKRMAQAVAEADARNQRPQTLAGVVEAIDQDPPDPIRGLLLQGRALECLIGPGKGCCTGLRRIAQMPEHPATDNRGQIDLGSETAAVLLIRQEIHGQRQPTPGEHRDQTVVAERTDEAIERHRRDVIEHRTQL